MNGFMITKKRRSRNTDERTITPCCCLMGGEVQFYFVFEKSENRIEIFVGFFLVDFFPLFFSVFPTGKPSFS